MEIEDKIKEVLQYFKPNIAIALNPKDWIYFQKVKNCVTFDGYKLLSSDQVKEGEVKIIIGDKNDH